MGRRTTRLEKGEDMKKAMIAGSLGILLASGAAARPPQELADLEGARAAGAESQMNARGYRNVGGKLDGGQRWTYWYNARALNPCVGVVTDNGRYATIQGMDAKLCNHGGSSAGAAAGVAVAAIIGAALLSHHDKHHQDGKHYTDQSQEYEYERGYNDGLHDGQFVNYDHNQHYVDGYAAGQRERDNRLAASRHSYSEYRGPTRGGSGAARAACVAEAARYWGVPAYTVQATDSDSMGNGDFSVRVAAGYQSGMCTYAGGAVRGIMND